LLESGFKYVQLYVQVCIVRINYHFCIVLYSSLLFFERTAKLATLTRTWTSMIYFFVTSLSSVHLPYGLVLYNQWRW